MTTTAARVLDVLSAAGVDVAFGLPGVHNLGFWRELSASRPRIVSVRHEQAACFAADGFARASGRLGVAIVTSGPGAANTNAAFGEAAASRSPVLLIASDVPLGPRIHDEAGHRIVRGLLHESPDQGAFFAPLAKAVLQPLDPSAAVAAVAQAVSIALTPPCGPVYVGIPADVLGAEAPAVALAGAVATSDPKELPLDLAARLIDRAVRPVLWVGTGAVAARAGPALAGLAQRLSAPVIEAFGGRGLLSGSPWQLGVPPHEPEAASLVAAGDLLIGAGADLDAMTTRGWSMPRPPRLLLIDPDPSAAARGFGTDAVDGLLVSDVARGAGALVHRVVPNEAWCSPVAVTAQVRARLGTEPAWALVEAVESGWPAGADVVVDMAVAGYWVAGYAMMGRPRRLQCPLGWGTLGYALPAAVGAAHAGRPVLAVCGDGGLAMSYGELSTLVQESLPVTVLVVDDAGYGMLRYDQDRAGDPHRGVDLAGPDLPALGRAFGLQVVDLGADVERLIEALQVAVESGGPWLIRLAAAYAPPRTTSPRWHD